MRKYLLLTTLLMTMVFAFGQTLYNEENVYLGYSKYKYNTVELNGETYDQYEVTIILKIIIQQNIFMNQESVKYLFHQKLNTLQAVLNLILCKTEKLMVMLNIQTEHPCLKT